MHKYEPFNLFKKKNQNSTGKKKQIWVLNKQKEKISAISI